MEKSQSKFQVQLLCLQLLLSIAGANDRLDMKWHIFYKKGKFLLLWHATKPQLLLT